MQTDKSPKTLDLTSPLTQAYLSKYADASVDVTLLTQFELAVGKVKDSSINKTAIERAIACLKFIKQHQAYIRAALADKAVIRGLQQDDFVISEGKVCLVKDGSIRAANGIAFHIQNHKGVDLTCEAIVAGTVTQIEQIFQRLQQLGVADYQRELKQFLLDFNAEGCVENRINDAISNSVARLGTLEARAVSLPTAPKAAPVAAKPAARLSRSASAPALVVPVPTVAVPPASVLTPVVPSAVATANDEKRTAVPPAVATSNPKSGLPASKAGNTQPAAKGTKSQSMNKEARKGVFWDVFLTHILVAVFASAVVIGLFTFLAHASLVSLLAAKIAITVSVPLLIGLGAVSGYVIGHCLVNANTTATKAKPGKPNNVQQHKYAPLPGPAAEIRHSQESGAVVAQNAGSAAGSGVSQKSQPKKSRCFF